ncbi:MAG: DUF1080 domain-containing protein [Isosphaeraceae bacterium]|nr:DUF1080 domain-containing protein [Isosphaeraceae bacterium]
MSREFIPKSIARSLPVLFVAALAAGASKDDFVSIFDGKSATGWKTNVGKPVPAANVQPDGLNPHRSGGYLVVHEKTYGDFVLDFDYKLSPGCNSGVFIRVNDLKKPVQTGLEIALDDTKGHGYHDTGAFYDLVPPKKNAQKPAGEWNHMTITANGSVIDVVLNGERVSSIDLDSFDRPGKRDDGSDHKFKGITIKELGRSGHLGFQDHGGDCWYRNVRIKSLD